MRKLWPCFCLLLFVVCYGSSYGEVTITKYYDYLVEQSALSQTKYLHHSSCDDVIDRLVLVDGIEYYGLDGKVYNNGKIVVLDVIADSVIGIFDQLKKIEFPIYAIDFGKSHKVEKYLFFFEKRQFLDDYNYTGSYSCRDMVGRDVRSIHSYGLAIDINPLFNPYININLKDKKVEHIIPRDGVYYLNQIKERPGKSTIAGKIDQRVIDIFRYYGFSVWGGYWDFPIDSHHFQVPNQLAKLLAYVNYEDAKKLYNIHINYVRKFNKDIDFASNNMFLFKLYDEDVNLFWKIIEEQIDG